MRTAASDRSAAVSAETTFVFEQAGDVVSARYRGGRIIDGYLIERLERPDTLQFRYVQADNAGNLDCGISIAILSHLPDGRLRIFEKFQWLTRPEQGENVFEEVA